MDNNYQANNSKCKCCEDMVKSQILYQPKLQIEDQITYVCQPMLNRHQQCNYFCINFTKKDFNGFSLFAYDLKVYYRLNVVLEKDLDIPNEAHLQFPKVEPMPLKDCKLFVEKIVDLNQQMKDKKQNNTKISKSKNRRTFKIGQEDRNQILELIKQKLKTNVIAAMFCISPSQVRQNLIQLKIIKQKEQLRITRLQQEWLLEQASFSSNRILFNAKSFLFAFKEQFPHQNVSISQFRKILLTLNIRYRIPSLKPFQFFNKNGKREEMKYFISSICGYVSQNYKLIFIDECSLGNISKASHKQWHLIGTFKETTQRISNFKNLIGSLGEDGFLYYQLFSGTGKSYIFQDFLIEVLNKAKIYYQNKSVVLILDNCSIHKSALVKGVLDNIPCIFTPAY